MYRLKCLWNWWNVVDGTSTVQCWVYNTYYTDEMWSPELYSAYDTDEMWLPGLPICVSTWKSIYYTFSGAYADG